MADEVLPSSVSAQTEADSQAGSDGASTQTGQQIDGKSWFGGLVSRFRHPDDLEPVAREASDDAADGSDEDEGEDTKPKESELPAAEGQPFKVYATQEEHDRAIQAEQDRREAVRSNRAAAEARKQLRRDDPEQYAQLEEADEAAVAHTRATAESVIGIYDASIVAPILDLVTDEAKRAEIAATVSSVETRMSAIKAVVDHLTSEAEKRGIEQGKKMARANGAVQKEVLRQIRAESDEPELVEAGAANGHKMTPNQWIRSSLGYRD